LNKKLFLYPPGGKQSSEVAVSRDLFVAPVSGSRGLHLQDIDTVAEEKVDLSILMNNLVLYVIIPMMRGQREKERLYLVIPLVD
jgi:hypothetical protein